MQVIAKCSLFFKTNLLLYAGQKYCKMLQEEHSAILSTFIKLLFVIKIFAFSIFERPFYTGFTVHDDVRAAKYYNMSLVSELQRRDAH